MVNDHQKQLPAVRATYHNSLAGKLIGGIFNALLLFAPRAGWFRKRNAIHFTRDRRIIIVLIEIGFLEKKKLHQQITGIEQEVF